MKLDPCIYDVADRNSAHVLAAVACRGARTTGEVEKATGLSRSTVDRTVRRLHGTLTVEHVRGSRVLRVAEHPLARAQVALVERAYHGRWKRWLPLRLRKLMWR